MVVTKWPKYKGGQAAHGTLDVPKTMSQHVLRTEEINDTLCVSTVGVAAVVVAKRKTGMIGRYGEQRGATTGRGFMRTVQTVPRLA
ncbi:MAG: hypothetical protein A2V70_00390 [Planctomycetes bacterium RBG_13_63_9]|nr:MAG: hypothetical protein A2V70_00390 [Planctomycetes bacterium RBG_13_63_9]